MKIWVVSFGELDDKRVLAQHREMHAIYANVFGRGTAWKRWEQLQHIQHFLDLHDEALAEMQVRGMLKHHNTPLPDVTVPDVPQVRYQPTPEELEYDRWLLVCRWNGAYQGRVPMPEEYGELLKKFSQEGCHHEAAPGLDICKLCKKVRLKDGEWVQGR